ncbi:MAG TPA: sigma-70 family RNA polymerase sigma factor, partial [Candidatus Krumholzibacteria bacterium]
SDLVQVTLWRAFQKMGDFEQRQEGGFFAYLRRTLVNLLRDELRRARARPRGEAIEVELPDFSASPLEEAVGREALEAYEDALSKLPPRVQEAVVLRVEWGLGHAEVADALGLPSANAARMAVSRALARLAEVLDERESRSQ